MRFIQSIIVFNSASAGDFLTGLCWSQLNLSSDLLKQESSGRMNIKNQYFKNITTEMFYNPNSKINLDYNKVHPVENSHYWLDSYKTIAKSCFFIDYPDHIQENILQIYLEKVLNINWKKNLKSWRNNPEMSSISLEDFFCRSKIQDIVKRLIDRPIINEEKFNNMYEAWLAKNFKLTSLFSKQNCDHT